MGNFDDIAVWIASDRMRLLKAIEPFPAVIDALNEAVECFAYTREHSGSNPMIVFCVNDTCEEDEGVFFPLSILR